MKSYFCWSVASCVPASLHSRARLLAGLLSVVLALAAGASPAQSDTWGESIGSGDGRIHVIPSLGMPSVRNGEKLVVSAVVKSQEPVEKVEADLGGVARIELKPKAFAGLGALPGGGHAGVFEAEWIAAGLEEKVYDVALTVTDTNGHSFTERSLKFSDPAAGISTPGTIAYPNAGMRHSDTLYGDSESRVACSVVDVANGFAYFGTNGSPGRVVKVSLGSGASAPVRVGTATLSAGEDRLGAAVIDLTNGYAYFGTGGPGASPARVVKVALGIGASLPTRVGAVTLNAGEDQLGCAVIDTANGYGYFGTSTSPGRVVKVSLGAGASLPTRVGALNLSAGEDQLRCAVIDTANGYAYFGTGTIPGRVVKVLLGAGASAPLRVGVLTLPLGEDVLSCAVINPIIGYACFGTATSPGRLVKVSLGAGSSAPTRESALTLGSGLDWLSCAVFDDPTGYAYFGTNSFPSHVVKVALGTLNPVAQVTLSTEENALRAAAIVPGSGYAYFATDSIPSRVVKIELGTPRRVNAVTLFSSNDDYLSCGVIDTTNRYAYFGTNNDTRGSVVKLALGSGASAPAWVASTSLLAGETRLSCAVIDEVNGYAYFGTDTRPGRVVKFSLGAGTSAPIRVGAMTLATGEDYLQSAVIDSANGYAYFGTRTAPGRVVKVSLGAGASAPARVGAVTLRDDETHLYSGVIDAANGYAYFGTAEGQGSVVKVALGSGWTAPTRVNAVVLNAGEAGLWSAVVDTASGYAYFGTATTPGRVVKISLSPGVSAPVRVGAVTLNLGENALRGAVIDAANGNAYFGTHTNPGNIVKVALGAGVAGPTRIGAVTVDKGENFWSSPVLDMASGCAYFGQHISPSQVLCVSLSQMGYAKGTQLTMPEAGAVEDVRLYSHGAAGNVRLALYDDSVDRTLLWESAPTTNSATNGFITVPISSGTPATLTLAAGTYHLAWQVDTTSRVMSHTAGAADTGFLMPWAFGAFPSSVPATSRTLTTENWTQYLTYLNDAPDAPTVTGVAVLNELEVEVTFSEPLSTGTALLAGNYAVSGSGRGTLATNPTSVVQTGPTTYKLVWASGDQVYGGDITITASDVTDLGGTPIGSPNWATAVGAAVPVRMSRFTTE